MNDKLEARTRALECAIRYEIGIRKAGGATAREENVGDTITVLMEYDPTDAMATADIFLEYITRP